MAHHESEADLGTNVDDDDDLMTFDILGNPIVKVSADELNAKVERFLGPLIMPLLLVFIWLLHSLQTVEVPVALFTVLCIVVQMTAEGPHIFRTIRDSKVAQWAFFALVALLAAARGDGIGVAICGVALVLTEGVEWGVRRLATPPKTMTNPFGDP